MSKNISKSWTYLKGIVRCEETVLPTQMVIYNDKETSGRGLIFILIASHLKLGNEIHYVCCNISPNKIKYQINNAIGQDYPGELKMYDVYSDPKGWISSQSLSIDTCLEEIINLNDDKINNSSKKVVIFIDKVEDILRNQQITPFLNSLKILSQRCHQIILYCGKDLISEGQIKALSYLSQAIITMLPVQSSLDRSNILFKKSTGKIIDSTECFSISSTMELNYVVNINSMVEKGAKNKYNTATPSFKSTERQDTEGYIHYVPDDNDDWDDEDPDDDLTCELENVRVASCSSGGDSVTETSTSSREDEAILAGHTTFKLTLTNEQRRAKNELLLPHTRIQSTPVKIEYTDDWDEDDPDDDLDI